nr:serine/threonine-protein phosphatase 7 long form homolog [Ipomoea batatas]
MWEQRAERLTIIAPHALLGPTASPLYDHWFYRYGRRLIGNPDHHQLEGYLQTAPSYIATVEALRHISIAGNMVEERGESNDYTNVMQNIARDELVRLREVEENVDLEDNIDHIENQHGGDDDIGDKNTMGDATQNDFSQALGALIPYVPQFGDCDPGSSSQVPHASPYNIFDHDMSSQISHGTPYNIFEAGSSSHVPPQHDRRPVCSPSHVMPNDPFPHVIQQWYTDEDQDGTQNSQVDIMNSKEPEGKITPKRTSRRLAEITRQEMLRARRAVNGDEEMELAKPAEKSLNEHPDSLNTGDGFPPREFIYFTTSDSDLSSQASQASSSYSKSKSSTAFSTNRKK